MLTSALRRLSRPSRIPKASILPHHAKPAPCALCGHVLRAGDEALSRAYDLRVTCVTCPWTAEMIREATR